MHLQLGAVRVQELDQLQLVIPARQEERRLPVVVPRINGHSDGVQPAGHLQMAVEGRLMHARLVLPVCAEHAPLIADLVKPGRELQLARRAGMPNRPHTLVRHHVDGRAGGDQPARHVLMAMLACRVDGLLVIVGACCDGRPFAVQELCHFQVSILARRPQRRRAVVVFWKDVGALVDEIANDLQEAGGCRTVDGKAALVIGGGVDGRHVHAGTGPPGARALVSKLIAM